MRSNYHLVLAALLVAIGPRAVPGQWSAAQNLNPAELNVGHMKYPSCWAATGGGFHVKYNVDLISNHPGDYQVKYLRRDAGGSWSSPLVIYTGTLVSSGEICEALDGSVHIAWENWDGAGSVRWSRSINGGLSFSTPALVASVLWDVGKFPRLSPFGMPGSSDIVMIFGYPPEKTLHASHFTGWMWTPVVNTWHPYRNEDEINAGIDRSPVDGTVYATMESSNWIAYQRYNGTTFSTVNVDNQGFVPRSKIAVSQSGHVMVLWENNDQLKSKLFVPGSGWGTVQVVASPGPYASLVAMPGTDAFYASFTGTSGVNRFGRLWSNGAWGAVETVSVGLGSAYSPNSDLAAAPDGSLLAVWENHGASTARVFYSMRPGHPPGGTGTVSGVVRDQFGTGVPYVAINTSAGASAMSGAGGAYSMIVPAGTHSVTPARGGYTGQTASGIRVNVDAVTHHDLWITAQPPGPMAAFSVAAESTRSILRWTNPTSGPYTGTRVVYKAGGYPSHASDGTLLAEQVPAFAGTPGMYVHTGLTNGQICHYAVFPYFQDVHRLYGPGATGAGVPAVSPDFDRDGDVDQDDYGLFQVCHTGAHNPQNDPACQSRKLDGDDDVDADDLAVFLGCFSGAEVYASPACAG